MINLRAQKAEKVKREREVEAQPGFWAGYKELQLLGLPDKMMINGVDLID